ncbi:hypothetical protein O3M35_008964 [Rhynocoris fuscipes]|uniref:Enoyl-CoA hydratase n=1 Tax=Rhynocoris fuscipes TaxID=488301 RepID=A0AAW1D4U4_9HEMI
MGNIIRYIINNFKIYYPNIRLNSARKYLEKLGEGSVDLELDKASGIATIFINNPKKKNAMSGKMMVEFYRSVCVLEDWNEGKALIIQGVGDCFCSGGDLDVFKQIAADRKTKEMSFFMTYTMNKLSELPLISFSFITGRGAFGGGAEIALSSDFCLIHPSSKIGFVHATMGVTPAWGGGFRLRQRVGMKTSLQLLLQSKSINAENAVNIGLVDSICNSISEVQTFMSDKIHHDPVVVKSIKKTQLATESSICSEIFDELLGAESNRKAIAAKLKHL